MRSPFIAFFSFLLLIASSNSSFAQAGEATALEDPGVPILSEETYNLFLNTLSSTIRTRIADANKNKRIATLANWPNHPYYAKYDWNDFTLHLRFENSLAYLWFDFSRHEADIPPDASPADVLSLRVAPLLIGSERKRMLSQIESRRETLEQNNQFDEKRLVLWPLQAPDSAFYLLAFDRQNVFIRADYIDSQLGGYNLFGTPVENKDFFDRLRKRLKIYSCGVEAKSHGVADSCVSEAVLAQLASASGYGEADSLYRGFPRNMVIWPNEATKIEDLPESFPILTLGEPDDYYEVMEPLPEVVRWPHERAYADWIAKRYVAIRNTMHDPKYLDTMLQERSVLAAHMGLDKAELIAVFPFKGGTHDREIDELYGNINPVRGNDNSVREDTDDLDEMDSMPLMGQYEVFLFGDAGIPPTKNSLRRRYGIVLESMIFPPEQNNKVNVRYRCGEATKTAEDFVFSREQDSAFYFFVAGRERPKDDNDLLDYLVGQIISLSLFSADRDELAITLNELITWAQPRWKELEEKGRLDIIRVAPIYHAANQNGILNTEALKNYELLCKQND